MNKRQRKKILMKSSPYIVAKKIKPKEIMVCTFAMNDEAYDEGFSIDVVCDFINMISKNLPKESALIAMPQWMTLDPMNKEEFRKKSIGIGSEINVSGMYKQLYGLAGKYDDIERAKDNLKRCIELLDIVNPMIDVSIKPDDFTD